MLPMESCISRARQELSVFDRQPLSTTVLQKGRSTKRTTRELPEQNPCDSLSKCSDGARVMPLHAHRPNPEGGIWAAFRGRVSPPDRRERRGKNGSARLLGTHRPRYRG